jgi:hypothetical protein
VSNHPAETPVLFLVFNRPDTTARVFDAIRREKPARLYIAADGPRTGHLTDSERCAAVRDIVKNVDWPCQMHYLLREVNLGCKRAVSSAITWFFEHEPEGIILEDDCLPDPAFFPFCSSLLERYRDDARVMHICGDNFQHGMRRGKGSYYFSRYVHVWGWASWRRAWAGYDAEMNTWKDFLSGGGLMTMVQEEQEYWTRVLNRAASGGIDTWDYQWVFSVWAHHGLAIIPNVNLVQNIGFGADATRTTSHDAVRLQIPTEHPGPLVHPPLVVPDGEADAFTFRHHYRTVRFGRIQRWLKGIRR